MGLLQSTAGTVGERELGLGPWVGHLQDWACWASGLGGAHSLTSTASTRGRDVGSGTAWS